MSQIVIVEGIKAQAGPNTPRIVMSAADRVAMRMPHLKHAISPRELSMVAGQGLKGRCRMTGEDLVSIGSGAANMTLVSRAGHLGIGTSVLSTQAGLKLPEKSATSSYTIVAAINIGDSTGNIYSTSRQLLNGFTAEGVLVNQMLTASGAGNPAEAYKSKLLSVGVGILSPFAIAGMPAPSTWGVVAIDFNNVTGVVSISRDGINWNAASRTPGGNTIGGVGYLAIGMPFATTGLTDNLVGDVFVFGRSVRDEVGDEIVASLVAALKQDYGIAG